MTILVYNIPTRALQDVQKEKDSRSPPVPKTRSHLQPTPPPRKSLSNPISTTDDREEVTGKPVKIHKKRKSTRFRFFLKRHVELVLHNGLGIT